MKMSVLRYSRLLLPGRTSLVGSRSFSVESCVSSPNNADVLRDTSSPPSLESKGIDGWQIIASVCITRHPVLCPQMDPVQHSYSEHLSKLELEHSVLSDFELKLMEDSARKTLGEKELEEIGGEDVNQQSALELLDLWQKERDEFDRLKAVKYDPSSSSVGISPTRQVVLVQKYKIGSQSMWLLPQGPWKPGETLRQTSERIVAESVDSSLGVRIVGNAPIGFYKYKYPREVRSSGYIGAKVFFYRGCVGMNIRKSIPSLLSNGSSEQLWLTQDQLKEKLQKSYNKAVSQFIINDD